MDVKVLISILLGSLAGLGMYELSRWLVRRRTGMSADGLLLNGRWSLAIWLLAGAAGCGAIANWMDSTTHGIECMAAFFLLLSLSAIDGKIRKIPNELLLALLILKVVSLLLDGQFPQIVPGLIGMAFGYILFLLPARLGISMGWGDIKLAAVAGFYLGIFGLFQAVMIMAGILGLYGLYLIVTKKGNLKSKVAIGPSLSLGMLATLLFPLAINIGL